MSYACAGFEKYSVSGEFLSSGRDASHKDNQAKQGENGEDGVDYQNKAEYLAVVSYPNWPVVEPLVGQFTENIS